MCYSDEDDEEDLVHHGDRKGKVNFVFVSCLAFYLYVFSLLKLNLSTVLH